MSLKQGYSWPAALFALLVSTPLACSSPSETESSSSVQATGELALPLVSGAHGSFRLRQAVFDITSRTGTTSLSLDSEADSSSDSLGAELPQDGYSVLLEDGWLLERLAETGEITEEHAALISANPLDFDILDGRVTQLTYTFTTNEGLVSFGAGALEIGVAVTNVSHQPCELTNPGSCPSGQTCLLADDSGQTFCAEPGSLPVGSTCNSEQCIAGAQCLKVDAADPQRSVCARFCSPGTIEFGCECRSLSFDSATGVCDPPPFPTCDPLMQTGCADAEACQYTGGNFAVCGAPGTGQVGDSCLGETCAAGLDCYGDQPEFGVSGRCRRFCDTRFDICPYFYYPYYTSCSDVGTGNVGRCF